MSRRGSGGDVQRSVHWGSERLACLGADPCLIVGALSFEATVVIHSASRTRVSDSVRTYIWSADWTSNQGIRGPSGRVDGVCTPTVGHRLEFHYHCLDTRTYNTHQLEWVALRLQLLL